MDWVVISGLAAAIQTVVVCATAGFAVISIRQTTQARRSDALLHAMDAYHTDQARADRRTVEKMPSLGFGDVDDEVRASYDRLTENFNRLGYLSRTGAVSKKEVLALYNASICANWVRLEEYVTGKRISLGYADYGRDFERLAKDAIEHIRRYQGNAQLERVVSEALKHRSLIGPPSIHDS